MMLGILDLKRARSGWLARAMRTRCCFRDGEVKRVRLEGGLPFCVAESPYPLETLKLLPGESLVLVTDGVTEAAE